MYMEDCCNIKKTTDGKFVLAVTPTPKKEKKGSDAPMMMSEPKTYVANNIEELTSLIEEHVGGKKSDEKGEYEKGFTSK